MRYLILVLAMLVFFAVPAMAGTGSDEVQVTLTVDSIFNFSGTASDWDIGTLAYSDIGETKFSDVDGTNHDAGDGQGTYTYYSNDPDGTDLDATLAWTAPSGAEYDFNLYVWGANETTPAWVELGSTPYQCDTITQNSGSFEVFFKFDGFDLEDDPGDYTATVTFTCADN